MGITKEEKLRLVSTIMDVAGLVTITAVTAVVELANRDDTENCSKAEEKSKRVLKDLLRIAEVLGEMPEDEGVKSTNRIAKTLN